MLGYFTRRILYALLAVWAVSVISFMIITLPPGDYVSSYIATLTLQGNIVLQDEADNLREFYGLNRPLYVQYLKWMNQIVTGNLGFSFEFGLPVTDVIAERLYLTILLALTTVIFIWVIAIPIGILSAVKQYSMWDHTFTFFGFIGLAERRFGSESKRLRWLSDSSYWIYLIHLPIVTMITFMMFGISIPVEIKFLLAIVLTSLIGILTYKYLVRRTLVGVLLNGKR